MKKLTLLFILITNSLCLSLFAQRSDTVFQTVFNNYVGNTATVDSAPINLIGQSQHVLYISLNNRTPNTCATSGSGMVYFLVSFDNTTFFPLTAGFQLSNNGTSLFNTIYAYGLAPFMKIRVTYDNVNCSLYAYYGGSLYPIVADPLLPINVFDTIGPSYYSNTYATAGVHTVLAPIDTITYIAVYGLTCSNAVAQPVYLIAGSTGPDNPKFFMDDNSTIVWPTSKIPYLVTPKNTPLQLQSFNTNSLSCTFVYRYER